MLFSEAIARTDASVRPVRPPITLVGVLSVANSLTCRTTAAVIGLPLFLAPCHLPIWASIPSPGREKIIIGRDSPPPSKILTRYGSVDKQRSATRQVVHRDQRRLIDE